MDINPDTRNYYSMQLDKIIFCFLDVESTGLHPQYGDKICEIGLLKVKNNEVIDFYETLINPHRPISPGAFRVNGITYDMVKSAPSFGEVANRILEFIEGTVIVAHNAEFDLNFISSHLRNLKLPLPNNPVIDTLTLARKYYRFISNSLTSVAYSLNIDITNCHRALEDAVLTKEVFYVFLDNFKKVGVTTLHDLLELQGTTFTFPTYEELILPPQIEEALKNKGRLKIRYIDRKGVMTTRTVEPIDIIPRQDYTYLVANCLLRNEQRTFRLDRILKIVN